MALAAIVREDGLRNIPGADLKIKINWYDNITTFVGLTAAPTTEAERTTVSGTFVCGDPFVEFEFIPKSSSIVGKKVGSQFELTYEGELFVPGNAGGLTAEDQVAQLLNTRLVCIFGQQNGIDRIGGEVYDRPCQLSEVDFSTKKVGEDGTVSMMVKFVWISANPGGSKFTGTAPLS